MNQYTRPYGGWLRLGAASRSLSGSGSIAKTRKMTAHITAVVAACLLFPVAASGADIEAGDAIGSSSEQIDAQRYGDFRDTLHDWKVTIGAGAIYLPEYEGSDKLEIKPFPLFSAQFGERVHVDITGVTLDLYQWGGFKVAARGGYDFGRKESDSDYLRGVGDVKAGGVVGGIVSYETGPFEVYEALNKTIGGSEGLTGTVGAKASCHPDIAELAIKPLRVSGDRATALDALVVLGQDRPCRQTRPGRSPHAETRSRGLPLLCCRTPD